jgi:hypothetical protein
VHTSIATANFYFLPFEETLEVITNAGFKYIELDLFWEKGKWAMAQHLKDLEVEEVVRLINQWGLKVSSIHDSGGVVEDGHSIQGFIDSQLDVYLDQLGLLAESVPGMGQIRIVDKLRAAQSRLNSWIEAAQPSHEPDLANLGDSQRLAPHCD